MYTPEEIKNPNQKIPKGFKKIGQVKNPLKPQKDYIFFRQENLLIIFLGGEWINKKTGEKKYLHSQSCFPLKALPWVVKMLDHFFKAPKDGGLPAGKIAATDIIDGEKLQFDRGMCVGGPNHGGYTLTNLSRINYGRPSDSKSFQRFDFPDPWLFDGGLLEFWKDLAERYERGEI